MDKNPKFLILLEGENDVSSVGRIIENYFKIKLKFNGKDYFLEKDKNSNFELFKIKNIKKDNILIYLKKASSSNISKFLNDIDGDISFEKKYGFEFSFTEIFSIFDYDFGSTSDEQIIDYLKLEEKLEDNFTPIVSYPDYEAISLQFNWGKIIQNFDELKSVEKTKDYLENINFRNKSFIIKKEDPKISQNIKRFSKQISRIKCIKNNDFPYQVSNFFKYLENNFNKSSDETEYYLENQLEIFSKININQEDMLLCSFVLNVLDQILLWIEDEE